jgi:hypothetical protein
MKALQDIRLNGLVFWFHLDTFGVHELSCPGQGRLISHHSTLSEICLYFLGQQAALLLQREPPYLLEDSTGNTPTDVLFGSFYDECVDVTVVNHFPDTHKKIRDPVSF